MLKVTRLSNMTVLKKLASILVVLSILVSLVSCSGGGGAGSADATELDRETLEAAMDAALEKLDMLIAKYPYYFPSGSSTDGKYGMDKNVNGWVTGFFTGMLFLAYEYTEDIQYLAAESIDPSPPRTIITSIFP